MMILDSVLFVVAAAPIAGIAVWLWGWLRRRKNPAQRRLTINPKDYPQDKVILFQMGPSAWCPSASPFVLKVLTYLRMAQIPHECVHAINAPSSKGKFPWIIYGGQKIEDSSEIVVHMNKTKGVDPNSNLDGGQRAISRAFQKLVEEELYWILMIYRHGPKTPDSLLRTLVPGLPPVVLQSVRYAVMQNAWAQGLGRHTADQLDAIMRRDLEALSVHMGNHKYFMGNQPSEVDAAVFGLLAQVKWQMPGSPAEEALTNDFPNLSDYCDHMKNTYFKDWDDLITHGGTREPKAG